MIYTVTFNPSLDYIVSVDDFKLGLTNRTSSELMLPGGKGINVSIVLKNLGIQSTALGFMAGFTGKEIARRLEEEGVASDFIQIEEGISRINLKLNPSTEQKLMEVVQRFRSESRRIDEASECDERRRCLIPCRKYPGIYARRYL